MKEKYTTKSPQALTTWLPPNRKPPGLGYAAPKAGSPREPPRRAGYEALRGPLSWTIEYATPKARSLYTDIEYAANIAGPLYTEQDTIRPTTTIFSKQSYTSANEVVIEVEFSESCTGNDGFKCVNLSNCDVIVSSPTYVDVSSLRIIKSGIKYSLNHQISYACNYVNAAENLGEVLRGDRIENSPYEFKMREPQMCNVVCWIVLDAKTAKEFKEKIDDEYRDKVKEAKLKRKSGEASSNTTEIDELSEVFGEDKRGRARGVGSHVTKKQLIHLGIAKAKEEVNKVEKEGINALKDEFKSYVQEAVKVQFQDFQLAIQDTMQNMVTDLNRGSPHVTTPRSEFASNSIHRSCNLAQNLDNVFTPSPKTALCRSATERSDFAMRPTSYAVLTNEEYELVFVQNMKVVEWIKS
ncbi:hypothetical protein LguiB_002315 [Lonicera macranthoides]